MYCGNLSVTADYSLVTEITRLDLLCSILVVLAAIVDIRAWFCEKPIKNASRPDSVEPDKATDVVFKNDEQGPERVLPKLNRWNHSWCTTETE